jgi:spermidine synthase
LPVLFAVTLFLSATLLFLVEPMVAKMVLPLLGGTPAVWNTCMVFFQAALLAGYAYAHGLTSWLGPRRQVVLHGILLLLPLLVLPIHVAGWTPNPDYPIPSLLPFLVAAVGLPFFVLSTSAPLLQKWFAETGHPSARDPYFLYAASNLGSMLALLAYPTLVEPYLPLKPYVWLSQSWLWALGYGVLVVCIGACGWAVWQGHGQQAPIAARRTQAATEAPPSLWLRLRWIALAFIPSSLMLGVTTYITLDIAAIPLLWVIPLALYLLSFILVFARWPESVHKGMVLVMPLVVLLLVFLMQSEIKARVTVNICMHLLMLFVVALVCHGELARTRPSARYLTEFFLLMSVGGVLGGLFNALIAPLAFKSIVEYPVAIVGACLLVPPAVPLGQTWLGRRFSPRLAPLVSIAADIGLAALLGVVTFGLAQFFDAPDTGVSWLEDIRRHVNEGLDWAAGTLHTRYSQVATIALYGLPILICYSYVARPLRFGLAVAAFFLASNWHNAEVESSVVKQKILHQERSFFGVLKVIEESSEDFLSHKLVHGTTLHGRQIVSDDHQHEPLTYYHISGPIGQAFQTFHGDYAKKSMAVVGLGTGTMCCYAKSDRSITFYDIDRAVIGIAQNPDYFTFWNDCPAQKNVVLGDARLKLAEAPDGQYDLIVVDAFTSDAIPIHLITREAIEDVYLKKLSERGILIIHISNRYLDLAPVLANIAQALGLASLRQYDSDSDTQLGKTSSDWVLLTRKREYFGKLADDDRWKPLEPNPAVGVWTDDYSNLLRVFDW